MQRTPRRPQPTSIETVANPRSFRLFPTLLPVPVLVLVLAKEVEFSKSRFSRFLSRCFFS